MEKEESWLRDKFGNKRPFKVPRSYFDDFHKEIMKRINSGENVTETFSPAIVRQDSHRKWRMYWRYAAAIAVLVVAGFSVTAILKPKEQVPAAVATANKTDKEIAIKPHVSNVSDNKEDDKLLAMVSAESRINSIKNTKVTAAGISKKTIEMDTLSEVLPQSKVDQHLNADEAESTLFSADDDNIKMAVDYLITNDDILFSILSEYE